MLSVASQQQIEDTLLASGQLSATQLDEAKAESAKTNMPLFTILLSRKLVDEETITKLEAQTSNVPYVNLKGFAVEDALMKLLPKSTATEYMAVPFGRSGGRLTVAMLDPTNIQAVDFVARKIGQSVAAYMASRQSIEAVLNQYPADVSADVEAAVKSSDEPIDEESRPSAKASAKDVQHLVQDAPITRALNTILEYATQLNASDIHVEPREKELKIRYRVDGILQEVMTLPKSVEPALVSRIKILSNLKIDEHRLPQDGEFQIKVGGKNVDLRIAISPVVWGEQVVIRLLQKDDTILTLDKLGFRGPGLAAIQAGLKRPHGMVLSTGPTGSGKSTTLYAAISAIKNVAVNIVTLEDPVEYKMEGINQIQVNPEVGLTFASGLRSVLRQDPNVIMVGEIRDKETADLAVQSALTGHVVLSTLHTNSAAGVLPRLLDMGVEPFLIASTVNVCIGQRLVRKLCEKCRQKSEATEAQMQSISKTLGNLLPKTEAEMPTLAKKLGYPSLPLAGQKAYTLYQAKGCDACTNGYKGRMGICEVFGMSPAMEKLLTQRATTSEIQTQAEKDGMVTMKQDGYLKVLSGETTLEEVARVAADY